MSFLIILQLFHQYTDSIIKSVLIGVTALFIMYSVYSGLSIFKEFTHGDTERAKAKAVNLVVGLFIFTLLTVNKDSITRVVLSTDYQEFTEWLATLITIVISIIIGGFIGKFIEKKVFKKEITYHVIPEIEDEITEKHTLIEKKFIVASFFGKTLFKKEISSKKIKSFDSLSVAVGALEEKLNSNYSKPHILNKNNMETPEKKKWAEHQLTQEQSLKMAEDGFWKTWTSEEVVRFQLFQEYLCMDFGHFHKCLEDVLGRRVFIHEFGFRDGLVEEYLGIKEAPSWSDIINLIPHKKLSILGLD